MFVMQKIMGFNNIMDIIREIESKIDCKVVLVIAGNYAEFKDFTNQRLEEFNYLGKWEGYEFIYCNSFDSIRGMVYNGYVCYGTYYKRDDIDFNYIESHIRNI